MEVLTEEYIEGTQKSDFYRDSENQEKLNIMFPEGRKHHVLVMHRRRCSPNQIRLGVLLPFTPVFWFGLAGW